VLRLLYLLPIAWNAVKLIWRLFTDGRVPLAIKSLPVLAAAYALWPRDLLPDILPAVGQVDDIVVVAICLVAFVVLGSWAIAAHVRRSTHRAGNSGEDDDGPVIEGRFRHVENGE